MHTIRIHLCLDKDFELDGIDLYGGLFLLPSGFPLTGAVHIGLRDILFNVALIVFVILKLVVDGAKEIMSKELSTLNDFQRRAKEVLSSEGWEFYQATAGKGVTFRESIASFNRYVIRPRILRDVCRRSLATTVLGQPISMPICVGPAEAQRFAHPEKEVAMARGAANAGTLSVFSLFSNASMSEIAAGSPGGLRWLQLYLVGKEMTEQFVRQAERAGFKALVVTVDLPIWAALYAGLQIERGRYYNDPTLRPGNLDKNHPKMQAAIRAGDTNLRHVFHEEYNRTPKTWETIRWLKSITSLPIVLKGVLTGEAAREAADAGVSGIVVSAHGGRNMDGLPAPLDVLPEVVSAVKGRGVEVYMDGGVRSGTDVLKALGLGARAVFIGRPALWGLACDGSDGVTKVLSILRSEFDLALGIAGCTGPHDIPPSLICKQSHL